MIFFVLLSTFRIFATEVANFFDKRSGQARILALGMKKEWDSFCPALVFS